MQGQGDNTKLIVMMTGFATAILVVNLYYYGIPIFARLGLTTKIVNRFVLNLRNGGIFVTSYKTKVWALLMMGMSCLIHTGKETKTPIKTSLIMTGAGLLLYFLPAFDGLPGLYIFDSIAGFIMLMVGLSLLSKQLRKRRISQPDPEDTWLQCEEYMESDDSVNLRTRYKYKGKIRHGWINILSPQRSVMIYGVPGSGKTFSVINPFISQMLAKAYTLMVYDFKYPSLAEWTYNELLRNVKKFEVPPEFCVLNFQDPRHSHRCNPIAPEYITNSSDSTEIADVIFKNVTKGDKQSGNFFTDSAKEYLDCCIFLLRTKENGKYCTWPHVIELMGQTYEEVFEIMQHTPELRTKIVPFVDALKAGVQQQLQGQVASARIPLNKFNDSHLFWVLSGNDFNLDINNPEHPKVLVVGNDPERQSIYGTTLALYTSQMFKMINKDGRKHCGIIIDEMPTIYLKALDQLIATCRSRGIAIVMSSQDRAQIVRDYDSKEADVITGIYGNLISGQVKGDTAAKLSKAFGMMSVEKQSFTYNDNSDSVQISETKEELMPVNKIENLSSGVVFGTVADTNNQKIKEKRFFGEVIIDIPEYKRKMKENKPIPQLTFFEEDQIRRMLLGEDVPNETDEEKEARLQKLKAMQIDKVSARLKILRTKEIDNEIGNIEHELEAMELSYDTNYRDEQKEKLKEQKNILENHKQFIDTEIAKRIEAFTEEEWKKVLDETVQEEMDRHMEDIIENNRTKIHTDIENFVRNEIQKIREEKDKEYRKKNKMANEEAKQQNASTLAKIFSGEEKSNESGNSSVTPINTTFKKN